MATSISYSGIATLIFAIKVWRVAIRHLES